MCIGAFSATPCSAPSTTYSAPATPPAQPAYTPAETTEVNGTLANSGFSIFA